MKQNARIAAAWVLLLAALALLLGSADAVPFEPGYAPHTARLGVMASDVSFDRLEFLEIEYGVRVAGVVPNSPAEKAGLREGDIIVELDGKPVYSVRRLQWLIRNARSDKEISLQYARNGMTKTGTVRFVAPGAEPFWGMRPWPSRTYLGVSLQNMTVGLRQHFGAPQGVGVLIVEVEKDSPADKAELAVADVIVNMDRKAIRRVADVYQLLNFFEPGNDIEVEVIRDQAHKTITVSLAAHPGSPSPEEHQRWWNPPYGIPPRFIEPWLDPELWRQELDEALEKWEEFWRKFRQEQQFRQPRGYI